MQENPKISESSKSNSFRKKCPKFRRLAHVKAGRYVKKGLKLKYLSRLVSPQLKSIRHVRVLDFMFPISDGKPEELLQESANMQHSPFFVLFPIKRITKIDRRVDEKLYVFSIEERWPNPQIFKGFQNIAKVKLYLKSQNEIKSVLLSQTIDNLISYITEIQKICSLMEGQIYDDDFDEQNTFCHEHMELDINEDEMIDIKKKPYIMTKLRCG